jgi:ribonuclease HII
MTATSTGRLAEDAAAEYLKSKGYEVMARNWRTRWCEIDIVAQKDKRIYFVEVKYRKSEAWGSGLEYITPKKLDQMRFAAEFWISSNNWNGDYSLSAIEVAGTDFKVTNFLPEL